MPPLPLCCLGDPLTEAKCYPGLGSMMAFRMKVESALRPQILQLQRAGVPTAAAELLLGRMQAKIESLCDERDRLKKEEGGSTKGRVLGGRS